MTGSILKGGLTSIPSNPLLSWANYITFARLVILLVASWLAYVDRLSAQTAAFFLVIVVFTTDALDGWVARSLPVGQAATRGRCRPRWPWRPASPSYSRKRA